LQTFWQNVFKEYEKENLVPADSKKTINDSSKELSNQSDFNKKTTTLQVKQKEDADIENLSTGKYEIS
jgi:hypothetical protein